MAVLLVAGERLEPPTSGFDPLLPKQVRYQAALDCGSRGLGLSLGKGVLYRLGLRRSGYVADCESAYPASHRDLTVAVQFQSPPLP